MTIEEVIKQKLPFASDRQRVLVNVIYTSSWLTGKQKEFFQSYDITSQQYNVLRILRGQQPKPISTSGIRERMLDKMSDASRIVDRLVRKELVERSKSHDDMRRVDVLLSDKGFELLAVIDGNIHAMDDMLKNLSSKEARQLSDLLDKLRGG